MLGLYEVTDDPDGLSYNFTTNTGDIYTVYFTEFTLTASDGEEVVVTSMGFTCTRLKLKLTYRHDKLVMLTILKIVEEFFHRNGEGALLYICMTQDGLARHRHIAFTRWFNHFENKDVYERIQAGEKYAKEGFYSTMVIRQDHPEKGYFRDAFFNTLKLFVAPGI